MAGRGRRRGRKVVPVVESKGDATGAPRTSVTTPQQISSDERKPPHPVEANRATPPLDLPCPTSSQGLDTVRAARTKQILEVLDKEVEARKEAIKALAAAQLASIHASMDRFLARIPEEQQNMPLTEYLKNYCPNMVARERKDGTIALERVSPAATLLGGKNNNVREDNEPSSCSPVFGMKTQGFAGGELSWPEYEAKLRALGHMDAYPPSAGAVSGQDSAMVSITGLSRGVTPSTTRTARIPREGEVLQLLSMNGSPLGHFTPGPAFNNVASVRRSSRKVTRSAIKNSVRKL
ncbi:hypothetical protein R1flu_024064 [Riccia fluitans]|uniref:Borealin N-terminal domain-containing protein n=1 Tax=Riccia fluitans TaxID=41844 RepID=A0ABD1XU01_9MARC